jgi:orotate phosphoribosyltransferase
MIVGAPLAGRVLIIDDVMSAGTSVRESVSLILEAGARLAGVIVALDRQEKGTGSQSAAQEIRRAYGMPVTAIASLDDVLATLKARPELFAYGPAIEAYRRQYGAT